MDAIRGDIRSSPFPLTGDFLAGRLRDQLDRDDLQYIEDLVETVQDHGDGARLLERGTVTDRSTMLIEGFPFGLGTCSCLIGRQRCC